MVISVYLHDYVADTLRCYGTLSEVVNKILEDTASGKYELFDKPPCPSRQGAKRYDVDITNEFYLELLTCYDVRSSHISLRRLLYWFVENEMPELLEWKKVNVFVDSKEKIYRKKLSDAINSLQRASLYCSGDNFEILTNIINNLLKIKNGGL